MYLHVIITWSLSYNPIIASPGRGDIVLIYCWHWFLCYVVVLLTGGTLVTTKPLENEPLFPVNVWPP